MGYPFPEALGPLNASHGLAAGLQLALSFNSPGKPVDIVNSRRSFTMTGYAVDTVGANGPSLKAAASTDGITISPSVPNGAAWTVSALCRFPIDNNAFAVFARGAANLHVCRNNATDALAVFAGAAHNFSPTIAPLTLSGWKRLTVCGHAGGAIAYLDGVFAGSHAVVVNEAISIILGNNALTRAWGQVKDYFIWSRTLGPAEVADHAIDPWAMFRSDDDWLVTLLTSGGSGVTGTIAATEGGDTLAASGSVQTVGTIAAVEAKDVLAAAGKVFITGTLPLQEAGDVLAASGTVSQPARTGTIAATESGDSISMPGSNGAVGVQVLNYGVMRRRREEYEAQRREAESLGEFAHEIAVRIDEGLPESLRPVEEPEPASPGAAALDAAMLALSRAAEALATDEAAAARIAAAVEAKVRRAAALSDYDDDDDEEAILALLLAA